MMVSWVFPECLSNPFFLEKQTYHLFLEFLQDCNLQRVPTANQDQPICNQEESICQAVGGMSRAKLTRGAELKKKKRRVFFLIHSCFFNTHKEGNGIQGFLPFLKLQTTCLPSVRPLNWSRNLNLNSKITVIFLSQNMAMK